MQPTERMSRILSLVQEKGSMRIDELAERLYVSTSSIRRDVKFLEKQGMLAQNYGNITFRMYNNMTMKFGTRNQINTKEKRIIGQKAAALVKNGDVILMDTSTTVQAMLPYLSEKKDLTVITNSIRICSLLLDSDIKVFCTGGMQISTCEGFCGGFAEEALANFHADWFFFSTKGISEKGIITDDSEMETYIRHVMLKIATKKIYLCDHSKFGRQYVFSICSQDDVDDIISDVDRPEVFLPMQTK